MRRFKILRSTGILLSWLICCALSGAPVWAQQETGDSGPGGGAAAPTVAPSLPWAAVTTSDSISKSNQGKPYSWRHRPRTMKDQ